MEIQVACYYLIPLSYFRVSSVAHASTTRLVQIHFQRILSLELNMAEKPPWDHILHLSLSFYGMLHVVNFRIKYFSGAISAST